MWAVLEIAVGTVAPRVSARFNTDKKCDGKMRRAYDGSTLSVYHWTPDSKSGYKNFGDELSPLVVSEMLKRSGKSDIEVVPSQADRSKLIAVGSVIHKLGDGDIVWGAGVNGKAWPTVLSRGVNIDVRAVRGPLTRNILVEHGVDCPEIYGDPGVLFPSLYSGSIEAHRRKYNCGEYPAKIVYIPNLNDERFGPKSQAGASRFITYVSPNNSPFAIADIVSRAELVISSSLHGVVFADAYGVPCVPLLSWFEPIFKYVDYFEGTGRANVKIARTLIEALESQPVAPIRIGFDDLIGAFPSDVIS